MSELTAARAKGRIVIADDQASVLRALSLLLADDYEVTAVTAPEELVSAVERSEYDVALIDLNYTRDTTSAREGFALLDRLKTADPALPILVMTGWSSVSTAVEAMRRGAKDYVEKPWDDERLLASIATHLQLRRAIRTSHRLREENDRLQNRRLPTMIAGAPSMQPVMDAIERIAPSDAAVLITGEHGTGKEVAASIIHRLSRRASKPLVTVNAGGLSEGVAESELFGHVKGAFTDARTDRIGCFEVADEGTLFLDEIANTPAGLQAKLLRVLQTGELQRVGASRVTHVDVRVLSATNAQLPAEIAAGRFREDLFYRLNTVVIHLPPLRERTEDILPLAHHYLELYAHKYQRDVSGFDASACRTMTAYGWPGNIRELSHAIERAVLMTRAQRIADADLALGRVPASGTIDEMTLEQAERLFIEKVVARHGGDVQKAAEQLGMSRSTLYRRLQQFQGSN